MLDNSRKALGDDMEEEIDPKFLEAHKEIKNKRAVLKLKHKMNRN
jgi:hypothetical protein